MTLFSRSTLRRLQNLKQTPTVWEGDRRSLPKALQAKAKGDIGNSEWIIWVDSAHMVRAMEIEPADAGREAIVRALLKAMEYPQGPVEPSRPQKIVVRDREIQFFLRGALQELNIKIDYAPTLPLIEDICQGLEAMIRPAPPPIPTAQAQPLMTAAYQLWQDAPWECLGDHQIITVDLNYGGMDTLYVSVLGLLGMEYGLLLYRSQDSLRQFRQQILAEDGSPEEMESVFLKQDCLFVNFDSVEEEVEIKTTVPSLAPMEMVTQTGVIPVLGCIHPFEGMRPFLDEEEAIGMTVALEALHRFFQRHGKKFQHGQFPTVCGRYRVPVPGDLLQPQLLSIQVKTLPQLAEEFEHLGNDDEEELPFSDLSGFPGPLPVLREDLVPEGAFFSLGMMPWQIVQRLRESVKHHQAGATKMAGDGLPILMIQTSQPKAKKMIQALKSAGGIQGLGFNPGKGMTERDRFDLGILKTEDNQLHLFGEYQEDEPVHLQAKRKWNRRCKQTKGWCGLAIARGVSGASRGKPQLGDFVALFEVRAFSADDLDLGTLQMMPRILGWQD